jgi:hypothetical protein
MAVTVASAFTPSISYIGNVLGGTPAVQTFSSVNIGAADANRIVVIVAAGFYNGFGRTLTGVKINGTTANLLATNSTDGSQCGAGGIAWLAVPTGTTATVEVTYNGVLSTAVVSDSEISVFRVIAASVTPAATYTDPSSAGVKTNTMSGGDVGVFATNSWSTKAITASSNVTSDLRMNPDWTRCQYAGRITNVGTAISVTTNGSGTWMLAAVTWS